MNERWCDVLSCWAMWGIFPWNIVNSGRTHALMCGNRWMKSKSGAAVHCTAFIVQQQQTIRFWVFLGVLKIDANVRLKVVKQADKPRSSCLVSIFSQSLSIFALIKEAKYKDTGENDWFDYHTETDCLSLAYVGLWRWLVLFLSTNILAFFHSNNTQKKRKKYEFMLVVEQWPNIATVSLPISC